MLQYVILTAAIVGAITSAAFAWHDAPAEVLVAMFEAVDAFSDEPGGVIASQFD